MNNKLHHPNYMKQCRIIKISRITLVSISGYHRRYSRRNDWERTAVTAWTRYHTPREPGIQDTEAASLLAALPASAPGACQGSTMFARIDAARVPWMPRWRK